MVDNVGRLEDIIAHMVPELPSNLAGPVFSIILVFVLDWRMGLAAFITVPPEPGVRRVHDAGVQRRRWPSTCARATR